MKLTEIINFANNSSEPINYITSPQGLTAIEIFHSTGGQEWYWVFTDHLGSITTLLRESDGQKFEMSFDACIVKPAFCEGNEAKSQVEPIPNEARGREGNRRDPATWDNYDGTLPSFITDRGYTSHENLDEFTLINMNGRLYDPVLGRMLSPDNYAQSPGSTQAFNRYSYALNNPLVYTDPSGDMPFLAIVAFAAYQGFVAGHMGRHGESFAGGFARSFGTSMATGLVTAGVGNMVGSVVGGTTRVAEMMNAGIHAAIGGGLTYGVGAVMSNSAFNWKGYGLNIATSMAFAGLSYQKPGADEYTTGEIVSNKKFWEYDAIAKRYNNKPNREALLKVKIKYQRLKLKGGLKASSKVEAGKGLTPEGKYVEWVKGTSYGRVILGYYTNDNLTMHISPYVCNANSELFTLVYTHEYIHYFQYQIYGNSIVSADREFEAHSFTADYYGSHNMGSAQELELNWLNSHPASTNGFISNPGQYSKEIQYLMNGY